MAPVLESVYEQALAIELVIRGIPIQGQSPIPLQYKGRPAGDARLEFLAGSLLVGEMKAVESIHSIPHAQDINCLKATGLELGLLMNFNTEQLRNGSKRIVLTTL